MLSSFINTHSPEYEGLIYLGSPYNMRSLVSLGRDALGIQAAPGVKIEVYFESRSNQSSPFVYPYLNKGTVTGGITWEANGPSSWMELQDFTYVIRYCLLDGVTGATDRHLWSCQSRAVIGVGQGVLATGALGAVWYNGTVEHALTIGSPTDQGWASQHVVVFAFTSGDQRIYYDGDLMESSTHADTILYESTRRAGWGKPSNGTSPGMTPIEARVYNRALPDSLCRRIGRSARAPVEVADLYREPLRRVFIPAAAAGGGITNTNIVGSAGRIAGNYGGLVG